MRSPSLSVSRIAVDLSVDTTIVSSLLRVSFLSYSSYFFSFLFAIVYFLLSRAWLPSPPLQYPPRFSSPRFPRFSSTYRLCPSTICYYRLVTPPVTVHVHLADSRSHTASLLSVYSHRCDHYLRTSAQLQLRHIRRLNHIHPTPFHSHTTDRPSQTSFALYGLLSPRPILSRLPSRLSPSPAPSSPRCFVPLRPWRSC